MCIAAYFAGAFHCPAGGGPQNVLVVVNHASDDSMALGNHYREARGIPPFNVFAVNVGTTNDFMDTATFSNQVRNPILAYIADAGLSNQIDYIVFSRDIPYRIHHGPFNTKRHSSLTSSMFYGFKSSPDAFDEAFGCQIETGSEHAYFQTERAFSHQGTGNGTLYVSTMLNAPDADGVRRMADRSRVADFTAPAGTVFLQHTFDLARMIRRDQYEHTQFALRLLDGPVEGRIRETGSAIIITNTMGFTIGAVDVGDVSAFDIREGALAEHLTSFGGLLFGGSSQMSITNWIGGGAAGSYGTVVEPCAFTNKFPAIHLYYWYARGFNLGESFYMSVRNPYQGIVLGDPLTQPYALPPDATILGLSPYEVVSGVVTVHVHGATADETRRVDQLDLFLRDRYLTTLTNIPPRTSNTVHLLIDTNAFEYVLQNDEAIHDIALGVADLINTSSLPFTATALGDRVEIRQDELGEPGAHLAFDAFAAIGSATELTVHAHPTSTHFIETSASYLKTLRVQGSPQTGDVLRVIIERLDGVFITNEVTATTGSTAQTMMTNLMAVINTDTNLQGSTGVEMRQYAFQTSPASRAEASFIARTNSWMSYKPGVDVDIISATLSNAAGSGRENTDVMGARATLFISGGRTNVSASYTLDTTTLPDGPHTLRAVAYDGSAVRTQGHTVLPFIVNNHGGVCTVVAPATGAHIALGTVVTATVDAAVSPGSVTSVQFHAHGRLVAAADTPPWTFAWDTAEHGAGLIELQATAFGDGGQETLSAVTTVRVFMDSDGDGLPDWWEYLHFGGSTNAVADVDNDGDGTTNLEEYVADTDPNDDGDFFTITAVEQDNGGEVDALVFSSSTARMYRVEYLDEQLTNAAAWTPANPPPFRGEPSETVWSTTNAPPATNDFRFFRVEVSVP